MARYIPIAVVTPVEFQTVHRWAAAHDVRHGGPEDIYDAPRGGAINVWGRDGWDRPDGHIHCTYLPERMDARHPGVTLETLLTDPTVLSVAADRVTALGTDISASVLLLDTRDAEWVFILYEPGTHGGEVGFYRSTDRRRWGRDKDWTAAMAQEHFVHMFQQALGRPLPEAQRLQLPSRG